MRRNFTQTLCSFVVCLSLMLTSGNLFANHWSSAASNGFFFSDTLIQPNDTTVLLTCNDTSTVCIGIPFDVINDYQIFTNGNPYNLGITGCQYDTLSYYGYEVLTGQGNSGPYVLQSWRIDGSLYSSTFNNITQLVDSLNTWDPMGNWTDNTTDLRVVGGAPGVEYSDMIVFEIIPGTPRTLPEEELISASATQIRVVSGTNEVVVREISTSRSDTFGVWTACVNPAVQNFDLEEGQNQNTCIDLSELLTDLDRVTKVESPSNNTADFTLVNNDSCLNISAVSEGIDSALVVVCDDLDVCDTTWFIATVRLPLGYTNMDLESFVGEPFTVCPDLASIGGTADTIYNICSGNSGTHASFNIDNGSTCVDIDGILAGGTDAACIVVCNGSMCDTTQYNVRVLRRGPEIVNRTVFLNQSDSYCEFMMLNLDAEIDTAYNACEASNDNISFVTDMKGMCTDYTALSIGIDTACIIFVDESGNRDTTWLIVEVILPQTEIVNLTIGFNDRVDICVDSLELGGNVDTTYFCTTPITNFVTIDTNIVDLCASIVAGTVQGMDTVCMVICDDSLICDTTIYYINVVDPSLLPSAVADVATTNQNAAVVVNILSNDTIPGSPLDWVVTFITNPANGSVINNGDGTITYTPDTDYCGVDLLSYEVCNNTGCDTADVSITVNCINSNLPVAVDDVVTTTINNNVTIDILRNDNIPGDPNTWSYFVIDPTFGGTGPNNGSYLDNMDGTITYIPDSAFCNGMDSFSYVVCSGNISNCDTAMVMVVVSCTSDTASLKVFNAFSPNNDGNNDCFYVEGIENLSSSMVYIYNRWGNLVFQTDNYDNLNNCWDGTYKGGDVPDGTYFYVIQSGDGMKTTGYVVIHR